MDSESVDKQPQQSESTEAFVPLDESKEAAPMAGYKDEGWSWGAAMLNMYFVIAIRKYAYLWLLLLFIIPFVNLFAIVGLFIYLGLNGREMARKSTMFANKDEYLGFMKASDHAGKVMAFISIGAFVLGLVFVITIVGLAGVQHI